MHVKNRVHILRHLRQVVVKRSKQAPILISCDINIILQGTPDIVSPEGLVHGIPSGLAHCIRFGSSQENHGIGIKQGIPVPARYAVQDFGYRTVEPEESVLIDKIYDEPLRWPHANEAPAAFRPAEEMLT